MSGTPAVEYQPLRLLMSVTERTIDGMSSHDRINSTSSEAARAAGWPDLTGSAKQISWANTLRAEKMHGFEAEVAAKSFPTTEAAWYRDVLLRETRASAWINRKEDPWRALFVVSLTDEERDALGTGNSPNSAG